MTPQEYDDWIKAHIKATGFVDAARLTEMLDANFKIVNEKWNATYAELCEATDSLIEKGRIPNFPVEHMPAILGEIKAIRIEVERVAKTKAQRQAYTTPDPRCDCPACNGGEIKPAYAAAMQRLREFRDNFGKVPKK